MSEDNNGDFFWSLGYGSNMDVEFVVRKKGVPVLDHKPACLPGYQLVFNSNGFPLVEPAFGNCRRQEGKELHGVAFKLTREAMLKMDRSARPKNPIIPSTVRSSPAGWRVPRRARARSRRT